MSPKQIDQLKRAATLVRAVEESLNKAKLSKTTLAEARELIVDALEEPSNG